MFFKIRWKFCILVKNNCINWASVYPRLVLYTAFAIAIIYNIDSTIISSCKIDDVVGKFLCKIFKRRCIIWISQKGLKSITIFDNDLITRGIHFKSLQESWFLALIWCCIIDGETLVGVEEFCTEEHNRLLSSTDNCSPSNFVKKCVFKALSTREFRGFSP